MRRCAKGAAGLCLYPRHDPIIENGQRLQSYGPSVEIPVLLFASKCIEYFLLWP
jgi:hypothetical protein